MSGAIWDMAYEEMESDDESEEADDARPLLANIDPRPLILRLGVVGLVIGLLTLALSNGVPL